MKQTVEEFLKNLNGTSSAGGNRNGGQPQTPPTAVKKVYLTHAETLGRYLILPVPSLVGNRPFTLLHGTREVRMPFAMKSGDNYESWVKVLAPENYQHVDQQTGQVVSSLTEGDVALLREINSAWEELYLALGGRDNWFEIAKVIRRKNYTLFHAQTLGFWKGGSPREHIKLNESNLFIVTAKNFTEAISEGIDTFRTTCDNPLYAEDSSDWISQVHNRELTGRTGYLFITVLKDNPGFKSSAAYTVDSDKYVHESISEADMKDMANPLEQFLGWQGRGDRYESDAPAESRNLFNRELMIKVRDFLVGQLAMAQAGQIGAGTTAAQAATNSLVHEQPIERKVAPSMFTQDPVLREMASQQQQVNTAPQATMMPNNANVATNPEEIRERNTNPFQTPPAAHLDPIQGTPFNDDLPF